MTFRKLRPTCLDGASLVFPWGLALFGVSCNCLSPRNGEWDPLNVPVLLSRSISFSGVLLHSLRTCRTRVTDLLATNVRLWRSALILGGPTGTEATHRRNNPNLAAKKSPSARRGLGGWPFSGQWSAIRLWYASCTLRTAANDRPKRLEARVRGFLVSR